MGRSIGNLIVGVLLALLTTTLLAFVKHTGDLSGVPQVVVMIISGMTAMAALTALQRFVESDTEGPLVHITFNETFLSRSIAEGAAKFEPSPSVEQEKQPLRRVPWDLNAGQLVGIDNALALARLRMDIERELRRLAHGAQIDLSTRPVGVTALACELVSKEVLPVTFLEPLGEIVRVCNIGIHGREVPDDIAAAVVRVGGQLLEHLRLLPQHLKQPYEGRQ